MRSAGILLPVFSLPGRYGIGCFSKEARRFVDFLARTGQSWWQILPLGPTGYGDSPYQSFSTFAGNPYFIDPETLTAEGLLTKEECEEPDFGSDPGQIDYGKLYEGRLNLLRKAFERSAHADTPEYEAFCRENEYWLEDYALFMAIKDAHGGADFETWEEGIREHRPEECASWKDRLSDEVAFYRFVQFEFLKEWKSLRSYAAGKGVRIIGDIPIYVSHDSSDFWANRDLFMLDERGRVRLIAGVPPDGFSADGQVWGNPLYDWKRHADDGFLWWLNRIGKCRELYDVIRIDHFRGFDEFFAIPADEDTAKNGYWEKGPGTSLFDAVRDRFGETAIIAEDLGYVTDTVRKLVEDTGFPNMKVLEFAFDSRDSTGAAEYLPYRYKPNCVVYTGTHDNETVRGWIDSILPAEKKRVMDYLDVRTDDPDEIVDKLVITAHSCVADLCIIPMQDYLRLDNSARINHPSTQGTNWKWRMQSQDLSEELAERIMHLMDLYGRGSNAQDL